MQLQDFGFRKSQYERPTQTWVCGWASEGWSCHIGPDNDGRCRATFECFPVRQGERWMCSRPETHGGKCEIGPLPDGTCSRPIPTCQPVRSIRASRGVVSLWLSALTVGTLLLFLAGPRGPAVMSPGDLTFGHGVSAKGCATCHNVVHEASVSVLPVASDSGLALDGSTLCLNCHLLGEHGMQVHGRPPEELRPVTERFEQMPSDGHRPLLLTLSAWVAGSPAGEGGQMACATCHQEHRGKHFDLQQMGNLECQACHVVKFSSLADGHPPFSDFPYERRTRIAFDHSSHLGKHFLGKLEQKAPKTCVACHMPDQAGQTMVTREFEATCAGCHAEQIKGAGRAGAKGIPVLRLPGLDLETLEEREISVGEWPADYNIEFGLTPFMKLLLAGDPDLTEDLEIVSDFYDLTDLIDATEEELEAVARIIWAVKGLFFDIISHGQQALVSRLQATIGPHLDPDEVAALAGQLPVEVVRAAQQTWLPSLMTEVPRYRAGKTVAAPAEPRNLRGSGQDRTREEWVMTGGWYRQDLDFALLYRPTGHADSFTRAWLTLGSRARKTPDIGSAQAIYAELSNPKGPGLCMKCHSVDAEADQGLRINWTGARPSPTTHKSTRFVHAAHFSLLDDKGCLTCHSLNTEAEVMAGFGDTDPLTFTSSFTPMAKDLCVTCHTPQAAGNACLLCHNYHVGEIAPPLPSAPVMMTSSQPQPAEP